MARLRKAAAPWMRQPTLSGWMVLGSINGLLPCGLVCAAGAGSAAAGSLGESVAYMAVFGLGTLPMMLGLALSGRALPLRWRTGIQGSVPWTLGLVGVLLIVRGLGLGIPYLSPAVATGCAVIDGATGSALRPDALRGHWTGRSGPR